MRPPAATIPDKVLAKMKKTPVNDIFAKGGFIRGDGRMVHDMYLMQVKKPDKSVEPWDYYNVGDLQGRAGLDHQGRIEVPAGKRAPEATTRPTHAM